MSDLASQQFNPATVADSTPAAASVQREAGTAEKIADRFQMVCFARHKPMTLAIDLDF